MEDAADDGLEDPDAAWMPKFDDFIISEGGEVDEVGDGDEGGDEGGDGDEVEASNVPVPVLAKPKVYRWW
jgi:hypothetical protein